MVNNMSKKVRNAFDRDRVCFECDGESLTEQSHADQCNINVIVKRALQTGVVPGNPGVPEYLDVPAVSYHEALELVRNADTAFADLSAHARAIFNNNPADLLATLESSDDSARERLYESGLLDRPASVDPAPLSDPAPPPSDPAPPPSDLE